MVERDSLIYIDDYAHHPSEIRSFLSSVRRIYPDQKITAVFQPHLFSRTKDFYKGFAEELSKADELILLPIYPAREEPMPGVSSQMIADICTAPTIVVEKNALLDDLKKRELEVLLTIGAGDIDRLVQPIKEQLENE